MWTGLGVIFIIVALAIPIISVIVHFLVLLFVRTRDKKIIDKEAKEAEEEQNKYSGNNVTTIMSSEYRQQKLKEDPVSTVIRKELYISRYMGDTYYHITNHKYKWGDTEHLYIYLEKPHSAGDMIKYGNCGIENYIEYLINISTLVHQYINATECPGFYDGFTQLLESDHELLMKFVRECHAAEEWKKDSNTIYDCDNYLQDFMEENNIKAKVRKLSGINVKIPEDFRHYKPSNPSWINSEYINQEKDVAENKVIEAKNNQSANSVYQAASIVAVIGVVLLIAWAALSFNVVLGLSALMCIIVFFIVLASGAKNENASTTVRREINLIQQIHIDPIYEWAFKEGEEYANKRYKEVLDIEKSKQSKKLVIEDFDSTKLYDVR